MKYNDKGTKRAYAKQQDRYDEEKSDRAVRRELERNYIKFTYKVYKYIDRDWWESVDESTRKKLYSEWTYIVHDSLIGQPNAKLDPAGFENWIKMVKRDIKPNVLIYRNKVLNRLLD